MENNVNNLKIETNVLFTNLQIEALKSGYTISEIASNMEISDKYLISRLKHKSEASIDFVLSYAKAINIDVIIDITYHVDSKLKVKIKQWLSKFKRKKDEEIL